MPARFLIRAVAVVACAAGAIGSIIVHRSDERIRAGFNEVTGGSAAASTLRKLEDAESALNPDSTRELALAAVLARRGRGDEAVALLRRATRREPENVYVWVALARVEVTIGRLEDAERSYDRARALNSQIPRSGLPEPLGS